MSTEHRDPSVRVRFCPSPTGNPHVGLIRTCLFNWAYARHHGGTFVFRIEDTDAARDSQESYQQLLDSLRWLGLDWDEGPEAGGDYGPYRQSERRSIHLDVVAKLQAAGYLYESFSSGEEIEARHRAAGRDPKLGYDNYDRTMTDASKDELRAAGRVPVLRFRMPDDSIGWTDLVRGDVVFAPGTVPDYVVVRGNGDPLYPLVNPVDDAMMRISHVLRGEDLLPSTPRQIALHRALIDVGVAERVPEFGHLPYVMGEGNKKLSKRDPQANLLHYRDAGYLPEGLLNYLALLGWAIAEDRDIFTLREMAEAFDVRRVSPNPARFDAKKCEAINAAHLRLLAPDDFADRLVPYLAGAGLIAPEPTSDERALLTAAAPLVQERMPVLGQAPGMLGFLFVKDITPDADVQAKVLGADAAPVLDATIEALSGLGSWGAADIEGALKGALVDGLGLKPRKAFAPVRAAITGRTVSPPLYESMELLGQERSLARLRAARELVVT
ncbi:glutamate--tRNA ligase [Cryptosporangium sp. NPDC051539]|uniref:glutamate--tRNA ligase n=1 Tax=Cryptosporangium sp. NPDC051539 TaxID=3363962 RepID=UPI0037AC1A99